MRAIFEYKWRALSPQNIRRRRRRRQETAWNCSSCLLRGGGEKGEKVVAKRTWKLPTINNSYTKVMQSCQKRTRSWVKIPAHVYENV